MRLISIILGILLGLLLVNDAAASEGIGDDLSVQITVVPEDQLLNVSYRLSHAVTAFSLQRPDFPFRGQSWQLVSSPDLIMAKGTVRSISNNAFDRFTIRIEPDNRVDRAGRIGVLPVGASGLVFSFTELMPRDNSIKARLCVKDQPDICDFESGETPYFQIKASGMVDEFDLRRGDGLLYVGPKSLSKFADVQHIIDERLPAWLVERQTQYIEQLLAFFADELYFELSDPLVHVISWQPDAETAEWSAGSYRYNTSVLKFLGDLPLEDNAKSWRPIERRLAEHVTVFYLDEYLREPAGADMLWFYLQVVPVLSEEARQAVQQEDGSREKWRKRTARRCRSELREAKDQKPRVCGTMLHLIADELIRKETGGEESYVDMLRRALDIRRSKSMSFKDAYLKAVAHYDSHGHVADLMAAINVNDAAFARLLDKALDYLETPSMSGQQ